ncbi:MAG: hypothetical protein F6J98_05345 [Moorea sp. SIO4G2]|uniref:Uncharacterized protein n=1 Tax=Moorena bouillonii PNG TaxID=568701 RepID=A0A1U7N5H4_9CYAN|nr:MULTISPECIES: DUF5615 family PIN-like protein [Moorena]NEO59867.1 hypothetical protein [Moorena sp. SIO4G2]NEO19991.1 hypothetical protein [Moorena sp. SIO4A5]NEP23306.1 hypothetical protein [Moorena sp. SIO3I6]NEQ59434.1 hypothetical protein [Moorena sp. SIO4A1]OLT61198.1 hypothetical protein BJP37_21435 [Moorena bouillonii PNG]
MTLNYLLDENVNPAYKIQLTRNSPDLVMWIVGEPNTPARGTLDPQILKWCDEYGFVLVTNNRKSMPTHLADYIAEGNHIPGIFILNTKLSMGENIDELVFLAEASFENEYQDQIIYLPHSYSV